MHNNREEGTLVSFNKAFAEDVKRGLSGFPKTLPSKYFYDEVGDKIFQEIMTMDDYYLTRAEHEIFTDQKAAILEAIRVDDHAFRLLELGAGDGFKTRVLLQHFVAANTDFDYCPVDISPFVLETLKSNVQAELPSLSVNCLAGDYFEALGGLPHDGETRNVVLFLGSNIGNFNQEQAIVFLSKLRNYLEQGDMLFIGFDLRKDPDKILRAYNDKDGITRRFNLNLLHRINSELGADINVDLFDHYPIYNPSTGECKSYLINRAYQKFYVEALEKEFELDEWEPIFTEVSKKYAQREIEELAEKSGFDILKGFKDSNGYFVDSLWQAR